LRSQHGENCRGDGADLHGSSAWPEAQSARTTASPLLTSATTTQTDASLRAGACRKSATRSAWPQSGTYTVAVAAAVAVQPPARTS